MPDAEAGHFGKVVVTHRRTLDVGEADAWRRVACGAGCACRRVHGGGNSQAMRSHVTCTVRL